MPQCRAVFVRGCLLIGLCALAGGCQSTATGVALFSRPGATDTQQPASHIQTVAATQPAWTVQPGMEVHWAVHTDKEEPGQIRAGKALVGPDGTIVVGPYGTCMIAGMTKNQAGDALSKHLADYMKAPQVRLSAAVTDHSVEPVWRRAGRANSSAVARAEKSQANQDLQSAGGITAGGNTAASTSTAGTSTGNPYSTGTYTSSAYTTSTYTRGGTSRRGFLSAQPKSDGKQSSGWINLNFLKPRNAEPQTMPADSAPPEQVVVQRTMPAESSNPSAAASSASAASGASRSNGRVHGWWPPKSQ